MTAVPVVTSQSSRPSSGAATVALRPGTKLYDILFGVPLILWYAIAFYVQAPLLLKAFQGTVASHGNLLYVADVLGRGLSLLFAAVLIGLVIIRRPASSGAKGFVPKAVALLGSFLGVAIVTLPRQAMGWQLEFASAALILGGMGFSVYALMWLGRSISVLSEARRLITTGPYAIVRHPLYLGEEAALLGMSLQFLSPLSIAILAMQLGFQLYRMGIEEQVMADAFPEYAAYAQRVKRLIPGIY